MKECSPPLFTLACHLEKIQRIYNLTVHVDFDKNDNST